MKGNSSLNKFNKFYPKEQAGFAMISVLMAIVIVIALSVLYIKQIQVSHQQSIAKKINNDITYIFNTAVQYYEYNDDVWPDSIKTLIDSGYLPQQFSSQTSDQWVNPYGQPYLLSIQPSGKIKDLIISTNIPDEDMYVAEQAMTELPKADLSPQAKGMQILSATFVEPGVIKPLQEAVKYAATVSPETVIQKPVCGNTGLIPKINVSIASFGSDNYGSAQDFRSYATDNGNDTWTVHLHELTNEGWINATQPIDKLGVTTKCQAP